MVSSLSRHEMALLDKIHPNWSHVLFRSNHSWWGEDPWPLGPSDSVPDSCFPLLDVLDFFHIYYIPVIILVGLVGNLLSCIVFLHTHLKMRSSSYYLAALATADFGFLATLLLVWLNSNVGVQVFNRDGWCQALVYVSSVCSFLSVWLIVAFTVERFIAVQYPLHRPTMCTVARAKAIVLGLSVFALITHTYSFLTAGLVKESEAGDYVCDMLLEYHEAMRVINIIDSVLTLIVPLVLIIVMNTMITRNLLRFSRRFKEPVPEGDTREQTDINLEPLPSSSSNNNNNGSNNSRRHPSNQSFHSNKSNNSRGSSAPTRNNTLTEQHPKIAIPNISRCIHVRSSSSNLVSTKTQQSITKMLLLISTVFILLNLPSYVIRLYVFLFFSLWRQETPPSLWCMQQFFMLLYYTNFSINFLLYSMCGITFRRCLWQLIRNNLKSLTHYHCTPHRFR